MPLPRRLQARRFPAPWTYDERGESFIVQDANGLPIAYVYFEDDEKRRDMAIGSKALPDSGSGSTGEVLKASVACFPRALHRCRPRNAGPARRPRYAPMLRQLS